MKRKTIMVLWASTGRIFHSVRKVTKVVVRGDSNSLLRLAEGSEQGEVKW